MIYKNKLVIGTIEPLYIQENVALIIFDTAIMIDGNSQLASLSTAGEGTKDNPYIIENYFIANTSGHGVEIRNTDKYFIIRNITIDGLGAPIHTCGIYFNNVINGKIENNTAINWHVGFYLISSNRNTLINNTARSSNYNGFYIYSSSNHNTLINNIARNNIIHGYSLFESSNNTLTGNIANNNLFYGFYLYSSSNYNTLTDNTASDSSGDGFYLDSSNNIALTNNTASNNNNDGYFLDSSNNNTLTNNTASNNNNDGFRLHSSSNNVIKFNIIRNNSGYGISIYSSNLNLIHSPSQNNSIQSNSFINNSLTSSSQAYDGGSNNIYHNNFWSDYNHSNTVYPVDGDASNSDYNPIKEQTDKTTTISTPSSKKINIESSSSVNSSFDCFIYGLISISISKLLYKRKKKKFGRQERNF
jgi:parallel beta-helix repeat protein